MATIVRLISAFCVCAGAGRLLDRGFRHRLPPDRSIRSATISRSLLIAFDLPRGLGPAKGSLFTFDVANGGPAEHLRLTPLQADVDGLPSNLPPPGVDRAYYLFAFSETDKLAIRNAQLTAQARGATAQNVTVGMVPKLCTAGPVDPNLVTVSVYAVLPGPLADAVPQPHAAVACCCSSRAARRWGRASSRSRDPPRAAVGIAGCAPGFRHARLAATAARRIEPLQVEPCLEPRRQIAHERVAGADRVDRCHLHAPARRSPRPRPSAPCAPSGPSVTMMVRPVAST